MRIRKVQEARKGYLKFTTMNGETRERKGGTVSWRCNNPGNVKLSPRTEKAGAIGKDHIGHAVFPSFEEGRAAQYDLLFSADSVYYTLTLQDAINRYAPWGDGENNPTKYARFVSIKTGIDTNDRLKNLSEDNRQAMLDVMMIYEGYKIGKEFLTVSRKKKIKEPEECICTESESIWDRIKNYFDDLV